MTGINTSRLRSVALIATILLVGGCGGDEEPRPARSQRQRDSIVGASNLPGARGVNGALSAQDSAERRKKVLDSIARADSR